MGKNNYPSGAVGIYNDAYEVTPSDTDDLPTRPQALWVGSGGDLAVEMPSGTVTFLAVADGTEIRLSPIKVLEATTADNIVACV